MSVCKFDFQISSVVASDVIGAFVASIVKIQRNYKSNYCLWHSSKDQPITKHFLYLLHFGESKLNLLLFSFISSGKYDKNRTDNHHTKQNNKNDKISEQKEWKTRIQIIMHLPRIVSKSENWYVKVKNSYTLFTDHQTTSNYKNLVDFQTAIDSLIFELVSKNEILETS